MVSVIIPVHKEPYLNATIRSLLDNAEGEVEIIPVFDGDSPDSPLPADARIRPCFIEEHKGMRAAINKGVSVATGEWIMKCDAHCAFAPGWDVSLAESSQPNWIMIPRRYSLKEETWSRNEDRPVVDRHYLSFPGDISRSTPRYGYSFQVMNHNPTRGQGIIDTMTFQGSCWFANAEYFRKHIYPLDDVHYGPFAQEQQEIGLKYWLGGGEVKTNRDVWYAHLMKRKRHYVSQKFSPATKTAGEMVPYNEWVTQHWMNNEEPNMVHTFEWLVEKFWPLPGWPENWRDIWKQRGNNDGLPAEA